MINSSVFPFYINYHQHMVAAQYAARAGINNVSTEKPLEVCSSSGSPSFQSDVYGSLLNQLQSFVREESEKLASIPINNQSYDVARAVQKFLIYINSFSGDNVALSYKREEFHHTLVEKLRRLIEIGQDIDADSDPSLQAYGDVIDRLCEHLYLGLKSLNTMSELLNQHTDLNVSNKSVRELDENFKKIMDKTYSQLVENPDFHKIQPSSHLEDALYHGDFPSFLFNVREGGTSIIRTAAATKDLVRDPLTLKLQQAEINPEFKNFLRHYQDQGKRHLYVNLMNRTYASEKLRSQLIQKLEKDDKCEKSLSVITLDKDSPFYFQTGNFTRQSKAEIFKNTFMQRMFDQSEKNCYFSWSKNLNMDVW